MFTTCKRNVSAKALLAGLAVAAGAAWMTPSDADASDACTTKTFKYDSVKKACAEGGRLAAKKAMKKAVGAAKKDGNKLKCKTCHEDVKAYKLRSGIDNEVKTLRRYF